MVNEYVLVFWVGLAGVCLILGGLCWLMYTLQLSKIFSSGMGEMRRTGVYDTDRRLELHRFRYIARVQRTLSVPVVIAGIVVTVVACRLWSNLLMVAS